MRLFLALLASAALLAVAASTDPASADKSGDDHRRSMGNLRPDDRTAAPAVQGSPPPDLAVSRGWADLATPDDRQPDVQPGEHRSYFGHGHWHHPYVPGYEYGPHYLQPPWHHWGRWRYPYTPLLYIPAERLFGPQAVKRFMGFDPAYPAASTTSTLVQNGNDQNEGEEPVPRASSQRAFDLGWRFIGFGDTHFANRQYSEAYRRYKKAADAAPALAEAYFRQGYALVALGNYAQAAKVLKRGLEIDPEWPRSAFHNDQLYGNNQWGKTGHLGALAQALADTPHNADLLFLLGVLLHFNGDRDRAAPYFERAAQLTVGNDAHLRGFMASVGQAPR